MCDNAVQSLLRPTEGSKERHVGIVPETETQYVNIPLLSSRVVSSQTLQNHKPFKEKT